MKNFLFLVKSLGGKLKVKMDIKFSDITKKCLKFKYNLQHLEKTLRLRDIIRDFRITIFIGSYLWKVNFFFTLMA